MQKLPGAPKSKYGRRMRKEKELSRPKKKQPVHFQQSPVYWKAPISFLLLVGGGTHWLTFPQVAAVSITSN